MAHWRSNRAEATGKLINPVLLLLLLLLSLSPCTCACCIADERHELLARHERITLRHCKGHVQGMNMA